MRISDWSSDVCSSDLWLAVTACQGIQFDRMAIFDGVFGPGKHYIPSGIYMRDNEYDRKRYGISAAFQWRSNDGDMELTGQYLRPQYNNSWRAPDISSSSFIIYCHPHDFFVLYPLPVYPPPLPPPFPFHSYCS